MIIEEPWEIEIADSIERGVAPDVARAFTIIRWAYHGDFRPLSVAIKSGDPIDDAVLGFLADMIDKGRLQMKPGRRGSPRKPETVARDLIAVAAYEDKDPSESSDEAIERIASTIGISTQSIRQAITAYRKRR